MTNLENIKKGVIFRLKKSKLKINASLSSICTRLDLIPTKVLAKFEECSKKLPLAQEKFFVLLTKPNETSSDFTVEILPNPDSEYIKSIKNFDTQNIKDKLYQYAKETKEKSLANDTDSRYKELLGHYSSFK